MDELMENAGEKVVIIVEDDQSVAGFLETAIGAEFDGVHTLTAGNGKTALSLIRQVHPAAVLLDIMLPGMNGLSVFDELNSSSETASIPVVFMSCNHDFRTEVNRRGIKFFLAKPFSFDCLLNALQETVDSTTPPPAGP